MNRRFYFLISAIFIVWVHNISNAPASESMIVLKCSPSDRWLTTGVERSNKTPKPTKGEILAGLKTVQLHQLNIHYEKEVPYGVATINNKQIAFAVSPAYIVFKTSSSPDEKDVTLDRFTGLLIFPLSIEMAIEYACEGVARKF